MAAPVGVELAKQPVPVDPLGDAAKARERAFFRDQKGRIDRTRRIIERCHQVVLANLAGQPGKARGVLLQHHPRQRSSGPLAAMPERFGAGRTNPAVCTPPAGSMACRSAGRSTLTALHRAAGRASREMSAPRSPASRPLPPGSAHPAHADRATLRTASAVPLAAPPPGPSPAPFSSASKTGQITRYKNRTAHESATFGTSAVVAATRLVQTRPPRRRHPTGNQRPI